MTNEDAEPTAPPESALPESAPESAEPSAPPPGAPAGSGEPPERPRPAPLYYNIVSNVGAMTVVLGAALTVLSVLAQLTSDRPNPYADIFSYILFPSFMGLGGVLILGGMRWEAGRRKKHHQLGALPYPRIDLNDRRQRRFFLGAIVAGAVGTVLLVWASYQGFHYTESVTFCGQVCHVPMQPEHTAYLDSPHARVRCVECHVGEGVDWYLKSKMSGARQLWGVITNRYARPIPTPVHNLRPARETCEHCHWREKAWGTRMVQLSHYRYNEGNDAEQITLNLKIGGGSPAHGEGDGIHWHMLIDNTVTYAAADERLQKIPWVKVRRPDGSETVYVDTASKMTVPAMERLPRRQMDCMDCHNRPAHNFPTPDSTVDQALLGGLLAKDLPWIKEVAVDALFREYQDEDDAQQGIRAYVRDFYSKRYPELLASRRGDVDRAAEVTSSIYARGVFPKMKVDWRTYPVNLGHRYWPGCFRCHDGRHVAPDGRVLTHSCDGACHTQPVRGPMARFGEPVAEPYPDWHPWQMPRDHLDIKGHDSVLCYECHASGRRPARECKDCHEK
ncbi:MAG: NapC/NirT family cytochrome c [Sorangiineae bacterium]|nr:NapC/NirT family cytochrome c [Polyangiaceae bacterium]MEB2323015.1 NapC/NirT family cytochrome c [Sorangiineae bacterium]